MLIDAAMALSPNFLAMYCLQLPKESTFRNTDKSMKTNTCSHGPRPSTDALSTKETRLHCFNKRVYNAGDDPPFLPVGTEVSAKYRGAFCEAKVKKIVKSVKCKVYARELQCSLIITDDLVTKGHLKANSVVEFKHPDTGQLVEGVVSKLTDCSMYTVVFDDGDEKTLRRTQCVLKGEKHFIESETLDNLPLSHPEHFGTPVMNNKVKRRIGRGTVGAEEESEESSSDEDIPKRATYKGRHQELVGKVMLAEFGDKKKQTLPVLVVLPDAHNTDLKTKDHILIKSFKDGKFYSFNRKELKDFTKTAVSKFDDKIIKAAMEKAITYQDNEELPSSWDRDELLGTDEEDQSDIDESSDDEPTEDKDHFVAQLYKFMDDRGTPINKGPYIGNNDLNLYRLFKVVQKIGGYNKVTNLAKWKAVYKRMDLPASNSASHQIKNAYKKYLHAFEDFYRKLGSSMGTISRPGRSRHNSGRGIMSFRSQEKEEDKPDKKESDSGKKEKKEGTSEEDENNQPPKKVTTPKRERLTRRDLGELTREGREKRDGSKDSRLSDKLTDKRSPARKDEVKKEEAPKKVKIMKKEEKEITKPEEDKDDKNKKVNRRRSLRKEEIKKEEEEETEDKKSEKEVKVKAKAGEKKEKKEEKEEKTPAKEEEDEPKMVHYQEYDAGTKLRVKYGRGKNHKVYDAKIVESQKEGGQIQYLVHYAGWNVRYDEWIRPDRIVAITSKPEPAIKKKVESQPKSPKGALGVKKAKIGTPLMNMQNPVVAIKPVMEGRPIKKSPAHTPVTTPNPTPTGKAGKPRATRSNSIDIKVSDIQPAAKRRTRKSSGVTESSDVVSQGSVSDHEEDMEVDTEKDKQPAESKESSVKENTDVPKETNDSKSSEEVPEITKESIILVRVEEDDKVDDKKGDDDDDESSNLSAVEQDLLNKAAEIQKTEEFLAEEDKNRKEEVCNMETEEDKGKSSDKSDTEEKTPVVKGITNQEDNVTNLKKEKEKKTEEEDLEEKSTTEKVIESVIAASVEATEGVAEKGEDNSVNVESHSIVDDRFEFKDEVENNLPEFVPEKEVKEKIVKEKGKEKSEVEPEKKTGKGRKKDTAKSEKKDLPQKEVKREVKRGRPSLAVKKAAEELQMQLAREIAAKENAENSEPPSKKMKEEHAEKEVVQKEDVVKVVKDTDIVNSGEEIKKEENEVERKKVKKKVKKKESLDNIECLTKESVRSPGGKGAKGEKSVGKGKGKKHRELDGDSEMKALELGAVESLGRLGQTDITEVISVNNASTSNSVIKLDSGKSIDTTCHLNYSATDLLLDASHKESIGANSESKSSNHLESDHDSKVASNSALYDNTPPTTPEHDGEDPSCLDHSQDSISSSTKMANIHVVNERQYRVESPTGNASPSSNDGSIGSGNVACSESSNNEGQPSTTLGKRRRESDDVTAAKRKRRGKSKQDRKASTKTHGSDSDETCSQDTRFSPEPGSASPSKSHRSHSPRTPKYHLNLEEGKYLEGEKRISFLMEKIQEIRKIYMSLKSEVACIDRRRKRARRKERDSAQNSSAGTGCEGETIR
ncbi:hypothetical protein FSP39_018994 [Pinctada imbricata]|uniref:ARID domain-containing protein n=1 Tax=Pinctada imbricata TaxID=66713 RepID=A0AA88XXB2_PINIB|nr:hypothetical protein FSP39_018994 [Pinctada imbricata]